MGHSKIRRATSISSNVYHEVARRDGGICIYCGSPNNLQCAHFIPRSQLGKGIPQNLGMLCVHCHHALDNGNDKGLRESVKNRFEAYLKSKYPNWDKNRLIYRKWGDDD